MTKKPDFDLDNAHQYFAPNCFNQAWDLIEKAERTAEEDEQMIRLSLASAWHWTQRKDCTPQNMSVAYWQTSRIYAILGQADNARRYGRLSLDAAQGDDIPLFYLGFAYEALARAELVAGNREKMGEYLQQARRAVERVSDDDEKQILLADLDTIK